MPAGCILWNSRAARASWIGRGAVLFPLAWLWVFSSLSALPEPSPSRDDSASAIGPLFTHRMESLEAAIRDLTGTYGDRYPRGGEFLRQLKDLRQHAVRRRQLTATERRAWTQQFTALQQEALLANPLLDFGRVFLVKRKAKDISQAGFFTERDQKIWFSRDPGRELGLPSNHECNSSLERENYDNEIALLSPLGPEGQLTTLYRPAQGGYVGELDLHWSGDRMLFTQSDPVNWKLWELRTDGTGLRQVSQMPDDVDCGDGCYLPNGKIVFGSTASYQSVPCWHGQKWVSNLYLMNGDGTGVRQLCFDQDHDFHPVVLPNGQILYHRWDYTGISHIYLRPLMVMNPDGTGQRAVYGSSSWFPNALYFPRPLPGDSGQLLCILSGYHGPHRMGQLVRVDGGRGWHEADGLVQRISGRGDPIQPRILDNLIGGDWPKFLHPFPLDERYFLVACRPNAQAHWGLYLADVFDNLVLVREEPGFALLEPIAWRRQPQPPVLPDRVDLSRDDGMVYLHDVHAGPGLAGVPRGTIRSLRLIAYHFGYRGLAGPDKIGYGGPWEVMRILGTVPVAPDGSALFRVPAQTPVAVQALDAAGKAVQLMRSWFTVQPGETLSCVGCHDRPADVPPAVLTRAAQEKPSDPKPWYGPARGFDFEREIQPVLNRHCLPCHDGQQAKPDLRPETAAPEYRGKRIADLGVQRLHPKMAAETKGFLRYTPAYDALLPYIRRVGIEDDVALLLPGEYHADTSPLVSLLEKGHQGVRLDVESRDRLVTWIDLNAPCHGTWGEVYPIPDQARERRATLRQHYGGPAEDPETLPPALTPSRISVAPQPLPKVRPVRAESWPWEAEAARRRQMAAGSWQKTVDLGNGIRLQLVRIPAGEFVMGDAEGEPDESPLARRRIRKSFWMGAYEISNEQYGQFDASHDSRYYVKRHARSDDQGLPLDDPRQPVVRVSWDQAMGFCRWLSDRTGLPFRLPTETQWEYACRAGSAGPFAFGGLQADYSSWANLADQSFGTGLDKNGRQITGGLEHLVLEGAALSDARHHDRFVVTAPTGSYQPNSWGLFDMHGNAAEWTRTLYGPYPGRDGEDRDGQENGGRRVVRGGSFFDPPKRCRSAFRLAYPAWQRMFNVGFRVVCEAEDSEAGTVMTLPPCRETLRPECAADPSSPANAFARCRGTQPGI